jgi:flagellar biosynthesis protein FlhF
MTINKFYGKTKEEAIEKAKAEFGENAVIMNVKEEKPTGVFRAFKNPNYEVTAAMGEKESVKSPMKGGLDPQKTHESINLTADEQIDLSEPRPGTGRQWNGAEFAEAVRKEQSRDTQQEKWEKWEKREKEKKEREKKEQEIIDERLESLSNRLDESIGAHAEQEQEPDDELSSEAVSFVQILYRTLLQNEVNEKYVNHIVDEIEKFIRPGNGVDIILSNVYQKLILRFGQPKTVDLTGANPHVIFFVGPTGVGKTTTIAKIASKYKMEYGKKVAFITADTYRIAATEQLQVYANILDAPMEIVYSKDEINETIEKLSENDLIFVDTAGFSHRNDVQREDIKTLLDAVDEVYVKEVFLVLSATTKYQDLLDIVDMYKGVTSYKLIFTKLDETRTYGNLLNIKLYSGADLSYTTYGQNVPDDIELFDTQKIVKQLLGGNI